MSEQYVLLEKVESIATSFAEQALIKYGTNVIYRTNNAHMRILKAARQAIDALDELEKQVEGTELEGTFDSISDCVFLMASEVAELKNSFMEEVAISEAKYEVKH